MSSSYFHRSHTDASMGTSTCPPMPQSSSSSRHLAEGRVCWTKAGWALDRVSPLSAGRLSCSMSKLSSEFLRLEVRLTWKPSAKERICHPPTGIYTKILTRKVLQERVRFPTLSINLWQTTEVLFCWSYASPPEQTSHRSPTAMTGWER